MTHLSMESLLALRDRVSEPGNATAKEHVQGCHVCQAELDRLHQRVAQLKALPTLAPTRDSWPLIAGKVRADRWRRRSWQGAGLVGLAVAASLAITVVTHHAEAPAKPATMTAGLNRVQKIQQAQAQSRALENVLVTFDPNKRVLDGQTAGVAQALEDRIAEVDRAIAQAELDEQRDQGEQQGEQVLHLWQQRVGLLDVLVKVHVNRASHAEF